MPIFIFDRNILDKLSNRSDARVTFLFDTIIDIKRKLNALGSDLKIYFSTPEQVFSELLASDNNIAAVFANHDYEPYALQRDEQVSNLLSDRNISFQTFKDHVIFEKLEITKDDGLPYTVFTPYSRKWRAAIEAKKSQISLPDGTQKEVSFYLKSYPTESYFANFFSTNISQAPSLEE